MRTITTKNVPAFLDYTARRHREVPFLLGLMGIGKTVAARMWAASIGAVFVDVRLGLYDTVDLKGFPGIDEATGTTVWYPAATLPFKENPRFGPPYVAEDTPIVVFYDEANAGAKAVLGIAYQLWLEKRCGEFELRDNVIQIAAGNTAATKGVVNQMPPPLSDRIVQAEVINPFESWAPWAYKNNIHPMVMALLGFDPDLLHTFNVDDPYSVEFGTHRGWEKVSGYLWDPEPVEEEIRDAAISGTVGEEGCTKLIGFMKIFESLTPIEEIIADPLGSPVPEALDVQYAMACHCSGHMTLETVGHIHKYLNRFPQGDMVVMAWTLAINRDDSVTDSDAFLLEYAPKYRSLFHEG